MQIQIKAPNGVMGLQHFEIVTIFDWGLLSAEGVPIWLKMVDGLR